MNFRTQIKHPEWMSYVNLEKSLKVYREGKLPCQIVGWMLVVPTRHLLRCIYGSDLRAAFALLWMATIGKLWDEISYRWWRLTKPGELAEMNAGLTDRLSETDRR